ncbi:MAG: starvation-inducible DNA-binding protein [Pseudohongiellaceae bacterium]|jgi:starvation-inducible DNA-binding protein
MTDKQETIVQLKVLLASTYTLYLKTHNYHWNVTGPMFANLHVLFETHYTELALAVDEIAERIRALGAKAPGSYSEFAKLSLIEESKGEPTATDMLKDLTKDQEIIAKLALEVVGAANAVGDEATAGIATERQSIHEKNAWMLRSHLE